MKLRALTFAAIFTGIATGFTACSLPTTKPSDKPSDKSPSDQASAEGHTAYNPELWPKLQVPFDPEETAAINQKIRDIVAIMSLEQKVGQMTQAEMGYITPEEVKKYHIGSVLTGGGSYLGGDKHAPIDAWVENMDKFYFASTDISDGGLAIPIIWGTDAVHGHNKIVGATVYPHNIGLGATRNEQLVHDISRLTALEVLATGADWTFSPEISVTRNDRWGRTYEGYSEDAALVATLGKYSVLGYQGDLQNGTFMDGSRIIATAKHYVGDGGTVDGVDRADNIATEEELIAIHSPGYFRAIEAGVLSIMVSHSSWQGTRMHAHRYLIQDILKSRLGFDGFVVGDWNSHALIPGCKPESCAESVNAGVDMFMVPEHWKEFIANTVQQVKDGEIPMSRIDDAVSRILRSKFRSGIMDAPPPSQRKYSGKEELIGAPAHRALARQAVRESLVLLKNNDNTLPLDASANILVVGDAAQNIGQQCGGWTISWQGTGTDNNDFPNGTSIYEGIKNAVTAAGGSVSFSKNGRYKKKPDVAIVVYGETPYAEWQGDRKTLEFDIERTHTKRLQTLQKAGIKTVSVFLSGRPMWVNSELNASDAFVAAWLPGTEGGGIADLLLKNKEGKMPFDFTGKLPLSWPKLATQGYLNPGEENYDPLFPFGFGLNYATAHENLAQLGEDSGVDQSTILKNRDLFNGRAVDPWQLIVSTGKDEREVYKSSLIKQSGIIVGEADQNTQGDAIDIQWLGGEKESGIALWTKEDNGEDFSSYEEKKSIVSFDVYRISSPTEPIYVELGCGADCVHRIDVTYKITASPINEWNQLSVDLACYKNASINMRDVRESFSMYSKGQAHLRIADVTIRPEMADKAAFRCQE